MKLPTRVTITEVGPRDGLQNEKWPVVADTENVVFLPHGLAEA